jgi:hypothetical protein
VEEKEEEEDDDEENCDDLFNKDLRRRYDKEKYKLHLLC